MPTEVADKHKELPRHQYLGELENQLRHGYGTYLYSNKFFRYEGQWNRGLKHGHGKLILADGGFYEGTFSRGEMHGHGYRLFGLSGTTYSGQFVNGERHGQGLLIKTNGEQYEGSWAYSKRDGEGILTGACGGMYEGEFHKDKKHGQGKQVYSNGDQYDGDWIHNKRHGAGLLVCTNGTLYDGQWRGDVYHGEGTLSHASGVTFKGMWINGKPEREVVMLKLNLSSECAADKEVIVEQGKTFSLTFECVDSSNEPVTQESGRMFKVSAYVKKKVKSSPRSLKVKSKNTATPIAPEGEAKNVKTLLGYPVVPYNLLQSPAVSDMFSSTAAVKTTGSHVVDQPIGLEKINESSSYPDKLTGLKAEASILSAHSSSNIAATDSFKQPLLNQKLHGSFVQSNCSLSLQETQSLVMMDSFIDTEETKVKKEDEDFLGSLICPFPTQVSSGVGSFQNLYVPPPPLPDLSHIISVPYLTVDATSDDRLSTQCSKESSGNSLFKASSRLLRSPSPFSRSNSVSPKQSITGSQKKLGEKTASRRSSDKIASEKEKLVRPKRERFAAPGTYLLVISESTNPPFLGCLLPDLCVEVKVISPKTSREQSFDNLIKSKSKRRLKS